MGEDRTNLVQSVERAVAILRCFYEAPELGITELSARTGLHKSTVYGIVNTLHACDMLQREERTGRYRLGLEAYRLGLHCDMDLRSLAQPYMRRLAERYGETVNLVRPGRNEIVYIEKLESPRSMYIATWDGARVPFYCSGVGRAILAFLPEAEREECLRTMRYEPLTPRTVTDADALRAQLADIRRRGYGVDEEEFAAGVCCVGVPVLNAAGAPAAGLSVSGPGERIHACGVEAIARDLLGCAAELTRLLYPAAPQRDTAL